MSKESINIAKVIQRLEDDYDERMKHYEELVGRWPGAFINGFWFLHRGFCWVVLKPTDIEKNPEYKGEQLLKVVPDGTVKPINGRSQLKIENTTKILDLQYWRYD